MAAQFTLAQEKEKYELAKIEFSGNNNYSSSKLSDLIISKETPAWAWKFLNSIYSSIGKEPVYFDSLNIPEDVRILTDFYHNNGFFSANCWRKRYSTCLPC